MLFLPRVKNKERFEGQANILQQEHSQQIKMKKNQNNKTTKCGLDSQRK